MVAPYDTGLQDASDMVKLFEQAKSMRAPYEPDMKMAAAYCKPKAYNDWETDGPMAQQSNRGKTARRFAFDSTGALALPKFVAICNSLITPNNMTYHKLVADDPYLQRQQRVSAYFSDLTEILFKRRYDPRARFIATAQQTYESIGMYGMGPKFVGRSRKGGLLYRACNMRNIYVLVDDEGEVDTVFYRFWLTARSFVKKFPQHEDNPPPVIKAELGKDGVQDQAKYFEFFHVVHPRGDFDTEALDVRRFPITSRYVCVEDKVFVGEEEGFQSIPYITPRVGASAEEVYGYSPANQAMAALGSASSMKKTTLKIGQRKADPPILAHDDGVINATNAVMPGKIVYGGVDDNGRARMQPFNAGDVNIPHQLVEDERADIKDSFLVNLFEILTETPEMTATEVLQRMSDRASLYAPTMGILQAEDQEPQVQRELEVLTELGMLNGLEVPGELLEAQGEYRMVFLSPLAQMLQAEEITGFMRTVETALQVAQATQDPSPLDHFNFDVAIPEIASRQSAPARWMNTLEQVQAERQGRAQRAQQSQLVENAPGLAGAAKVINEMQGGA